MANETFSKWVPFNKKEELEGYCDWKKPGIYVIAYSNDNISNRDFEFEEHIVYFGMTNSKGGLKSRLKQFENTINNKNIQHGGAERFLNYYSNDNDWKQKLYVSIKVFQCDVNSNSYDDLLVMGEVAREEYVCFSKYVEKFKGLPRFNDKKGSPKKPKK